MRRGLLLDVIFRARGAGGGEVEGFWLLMEGGAGGEGSGLGWGNGSTGRVDGVDVVDVGAVGGGSCSVVGVQVGGWGV